MSTEPLAFTCAAACPVSRQCLRATIGSPDPAPGDLPVDPDAGCALWITDSPLNRKLWADLQAS